VRVRAGQLGALIVYARLQRVEELPPALEGGALADEPGPEPIRIDPLSIEPLRLDAEGVSR
jgi:hypothetical protein